MQYAISELQKRGFAPIQMGETRIDFTCKGCVIQFFPYSGWHTGRTIKDGRGIEKLLKQLI